MGNFKVGQKVCYAGDTYHIYGVIKEAGVVSRVENQYILGIGKLDKFYESWVPTQDLLSWEEGIQLNKKYVVITYKKLIAVLKQIYALEQELNNA